MVLSGFYCNHHRQHQVRQPSCQRRGRKPSFGDRRRHSPSEGSILHDQGQHVCAGT